MLVRARTQLRERAARAAEEARTIRPANMERRDRRSGEESRTLPGGMEDSEDL